MYITKTTKIIPKVPITNENICTKYTNKNKTKYKKYIYKCTLKYN